MTQFFLSIAFAACPKFYGKEIRPNEWEFRNSKKSGYVEVEVQEDERGQCFPQAGAFDLVDGKMVINKEKLEAKRAKEKLEQIDGLKKKKIEIEEKIKEAEEQK